MKGYVIVPFFIWLNPIIIQELKHRKKTMLTYQKIKGIILFILLFSMSFAQDADTTAVEEEDSGREMYTSFDVSFSNDKGNIDYRSLYYGFNYMLLGDLGPFKDTEFLFDFTRSDDQLDGEPFTDDQALTLKFDVWANQRFSPFLFFQNSFDKTIGLNNRLNYGVGAKLGLFKGFSISYAFLAETEDYVKFTGMDYDSSYVDWYEYTDSIWWGEYDYDLTEFTDEDQEYYYWVIPDTTIDGVDYIFTDSTLIYADYYYTDSVATGEKYWEYTDSTQYTTGGKSKQFFRHSIRPKFKIKLFDDNLIFDYRFYFKPKVDDWEDYLLEHELKISFVTFYEALSIDFSYTDKYNARYDLTKNGNRKYFNPESGVLFKEKDQSFVVGLSFAL